MSRKLEIRAGTQLLAALLGMGALIAVTSTGGCNGAKGGPNASPAPPPPAPSNWAVFYYMIGRNTSGQQSENSFTIITSNTKVTATPPIIPAPSFIEIDYSTINMATPPFTTTKRFSNFNGIVSSLVDEGQTAMTDPNEFAAFIQAGRNSVPQAVRYALVIQGPGGMPFLGAGSDTAAIASSNLDLAKLDTALTTAANTTGLKLFDLVVLDIPQGATAEAIAMLANHAKNVVANETCAPFAGFDYGGLSGFLANNQSGSNLPNLVQSGLLPNVQAAFTAQQNEIADSAILLPQTNLLKALDTFASALVAEINSGAPVVNLNAIGAIGSCRAGALAIDINTKTDLVDLGSFAGLIATVTSNGKPVFSTSTQTAATSLGTLINANTKSAAFFGNDWGNLTGLAIYFPHSSKTYNNNYTTVAAALNAAAPNWNTFLTTYLGVVATSAQAPLVTNVVAPPAITQGTSFTASAQIFPLAQIHDVTLLVTQIVGNQNVVVLRVPLGAPDPQTGTISFTGPMAFTAAKTPTDGPFLLPLARDQSGTFAQQKLLAGDCDQTYSTAAGNVTVPGFLKVEVAVLGSYSAVAWTPTEANGAVGRDDKPLPTVKGVTYTLFPRTVVVDATGNMTSLTQATNALRSTTGAIVVDGNQFLNQPTPITAQLWFVAENFNGDFGASSINITLN